MRSFYYLYRSALSRAYCRKTHGYDWWGSRTLLLIISSHLHRKTASLSLLSSTACSLWSDSKAPVFSRVGCWGRCWWWLVLWIWYYCSMHRCRGGWSGSVAAWSWLSSSCDVCYLSDYALILFFIRFLFLPFTGVREVFKEFVIIGSWFLPWRARVTVGSSCRVL